MRLDQLIVCHGLLKLVHVGLVVCKVGLLVVLVMEELQAACSLPACSSQFLC